MYFNILQAYRKPTGKRRLFDGRKTPSFFQENEELAVLRLRLSSQKTSFSSEKTPSFSQWPHFCLPKSVIWVENKPKTGGKFCRLTCFAFLLRCLENKDKEIVFCWFCDVMQMALSFLQDYRFYCSELSDMIYKFVLESTCGLFEYRKR